MVLKRIFVGGLPIQKPHTEVNDIGHLALQNHFSLE